MVLSTKTTPIYFRNSFFFICFWIPQRQIQCFSRQKLTCTVFNRNSQGFQCLQQVVFSPCIPLLSSVQVTFLKAWSSCFCFITMVPSSTLISCFLCQDNNSQAFNTIRFWVLSYSEIHNITLDIEYHFPSPSIHSILSK